MNKRKIYRGFAVIAVLFVGLMFLEIGSFIILKLSHVDTSQDYRLAYNHGASGSHGWEKLTNPNPAIAVKQAHPYFGHVFGIGNNYGFLSPFDYPYKKKNNEFVIGIFGGSTAMHWADFLSTTQRWSKTLEKSGKKIVIMNLALSGYHQPQQLNVASKFIENLDLALVMDGWNDAVLSACPLEPEAPQDYKIIFDKMNLSGHINELRRLTQDFRKFSYFLENNFLGSTTAAFTIWNLYERSLKLKHTEIMKSEILPDKKFAECDLPYPEIQKNNFYTWLKYTRQMKAISELHKVPLLHFLQANPYVTKAKIMDSTEKDIVQFEQTMKSSGLANGPFTIFYDHYLKTPLAHTTDLTFLFKDEPRVTYIDPYTHLNELGYQLVSDFVWKKIEKDAIFK